MFTEARTQALTALVENLPTQGLESEAQGVRAAIVGLAIETTDALACWREGFEEGSRLQGVAK